MGKFHYGIGSQNSNNNHTASMLTIIIKLTFYTHQNLLADETDIILELQQEDLAGLPSDLVAAARQAAADRAKSSDTYVITLSRSLVEPFITDSERRDLRERAWRLWTNRGGGACRCMLCCQIICEFLVG